MSQTESERDIHRRMNGRLLRWATFRRAPRRPGAPISRAYSHDPPSISNLPGSYQERWAIWQARNIENAKVIEGGLRRMTPRQRQIIFQRFVLDYSWRQIAAGLGVAVKTVYRDRDRAFHLLSEQFTRRDAARAAGPQQVAESGR